MFKIAFLGDLTVDIYKDLKEVRLGGASLNQAIWTKRLKQQSTILGAVGTDWFGRKYFKFFQQKKIKHLVKTVSGKTSQIEITLNKQGERFFGNWEPGVLKKYHLTREEKVFLKTQDAVCLPVYFPTRHLLTELTQSNKAYESYQTESLLVADFDDLSHFSKKTDFLEKHLPLLNLLFLGLDKTNDKKLINKIKKFSQKYQKIIVVTLNQEGSVAFDKGKPIWQKAQKVKVVDSTGGGDAFLVGFLVEFLKTRNLQKALAAGTEIASLAISRLGAY